MQPGGAPLGNEGVQTGHPPLGALAPPAARLGSGQGALGSPELPHGRAQVAWVVHHIPGTLTILQVDAEGPFPARAAQAESPA